MTGQTTISRWQQLCLGFLCLLSPVIRTLPRQSALFAGPYAWLSAVLAIIPLTLIFLLVRRFLKNALPGEGFAELFIRALGRPLGKAVILIYTLWFVFYAALTLRSAADRYIASAYQNSSPVFFIVVLVILGLLAALGPFRSISRTAEVFSPLVAIVLALIFILALGNIDPLFLPAPTISQTPQILSGVPNISAVLGISVLYFGFLEGRIREKEKRTRTFFVFLLIIITVIVLLCVTTIGAFGAKLVSRASFPFFTMVSNLTLFSGIDRLESLILALWVIMDFVLVATLLFVITNNLRVCFGYTPDSAEKARTFDFKNGRWIIWLAAALALVLALTFAPNTFTLSELSTTIVPMVNLGLVFGLLPLIIVIGIIRKRV